MSSILWGLIAASTVISALMSVATAVKGDLNAKGA